MKDDELDELEIAEEQSDGERSQRNTKDAYEDPEIKERRSGPKGVMNSNLIVFLYLAGAAVLVGLMLFSGHKKKPVQKKDEITKAAIAGASETDPAQNVQQLRSQLSDERTRQRKDEQDAAQALAVAQAGDVTPLYGPNGQFISPAAQKKNSYNTGTVSLSQYQQSETPQPPVKSVAEVQQEDIDKRLRELQFSTRFQSNLVYRAEPIKQQSSSSEFSSQQHSEQSDLAARQMQESVPGFIPQGSLSPRQLQAAIGTVLPQPQRADGQTTPADPEHTKARQEISVNQSIGKDYVVFEGTFLDTVLVNQLDGDAAGPVITMVTQPIYSHDHQHVLIPDGTKVFGEAKKIGEVGFGQQRRMAVVFHRLIMPDGYSIDLDQFDGLNQIGEMGLKDRVNNHYLQIFGTSIALGLIAGAAQVEQGGSTLTANGQQTFVNGVAGSLSNSSTSILNKFMQIPPTITIRPGNRVKIYITQDMRIPAYVNHTINPTF
jgi:type IV secretory pathway VirB10-like protein